MVNNKLKFNVINLTDRFVLRKISPWFRFVLARIFSSRPDRFYGSLKNILQISDQPFDHPFGIEEQQGDHTFAF